jgi:hypothetical protein
VGRLEDRMLRSWFSLRRFGDFLATAEQVTAAGDTPAVLLTQVIPPDGVAPEGVAPEGVAPEGVAP